MIDVTRVSGYRKKGDYELWDTTEKPLSVYVEALRFRLAIFAPCFPKAVLTDFGR